MDQRPLIVSLSLVLLVALAAGVYLGMGARPNLGLDLQGGISAVYSPQLPEGEEEPEDIDEILDETIEVIRERVDSLGVAEPEIARSGDDVQVQLPGIADADRVQEIIGTTAQLSFRRVIEEIPPGSERHDEGPDCDAPVDEVEELADDDEGIICAAVEADGAEDAEVEPTKFEVGPAELTGDHVEDASVQVGQGQQQFQVGLDLDATGAEAFEQITSDLACQRDQGREDRFAIVLDGRVEAAPGMNPGVACDVGITDGRASITTGAGDSREEQEQEAADLALVLRTGALPIT
ncbi:MAG: preprotein translocase subunit SecD, partial [Nitriliruptoraceae bacterium]